MNTQITVKDNSKEFLKEFNSRVEKALEAVGIHLEGEAKEELENSPRRIDTGLLRNSITHAISGKPAAITSYSASNDSRSGRPGGSGSYSGNAPSDPPDQMAVYVGTNVEYAPYVHEGTSRMSPNRFLKNAAVRNKDQIREYIKKELKS